MNKTRYALCGLSVRAINHFLLPLLGKVTSPGANDFSAHSEVTGILDIDAGRVAAFNKSVGEEIPFVSAEEGIDEFIARTRPDVLLVAGPDYTHAEHIIAGLRHNLRVIAEKPVVISCEQMQAVLEAEQQSSGSLVVAHNGRYNPQLGLLRQLIAQGEIGRITNVEYVYNLNTFHGASYFYRWNRERARSGGLSIHKGVHHFDALGWLINDHPETVFALGARNYYGPQGAHNPQLATDEKLTLAQVRERCPYFKKHYLSRRTPESGRPTPGWDTLKLPYDAQYPDDAYIYDEAIDIEDTYSAVIGYRSGVSVSYSCNFSTPMEGYVLAINGTKGRLEASRFVNPDPTGHNTEGEKNSVVRVTPLFDGGMTEIPVPKLEGGHGGSDPLIQRDLFLGLSEQSRSSNLQADSYAGALAVAVGEAVWRSASEGRPFTTRELLGKWYRSANGN